MDPTEVKIKGYLEEINKSPKKKSYLYNPITKGDYVFILGVQTGIVLFPSPRNDGNIAFRWLGSDNGSLETWGFEHDWKIVEWLEEDFAVLKVAAEYVKNFATTEEKVTNMPFGKTLDHSYSLPWLFSKKKTYNG